MLILILESRKLFKCSVKSPDFRIKLTVWVLLIECNCIFLFQSNESLKWTKLFISLDQSKLCTYHKMSFFCPFTKLLLKDLSIPPNRKTVYTTGRDFKTFFSCKAASHRTSKLVQAAPVYQIQATLRESDWWGPPRPLQAPQGLCECVSKKLRMRVFWCFSFFLYAHVRVCVCLLGLGALASDWVFWEQRGVQKARQWSNRISS